MIAGIPGEIGRKTFRRKIRRQTWMTSSNLLSTLFVQGIPITVVVVVRYSETLLRAETHCLSSIDIPVLAAGSARASSASNLALDHRS